jgi:putative endopeptidase
MGLRRRDASQVLIDEHAPIEFRRPTVRNVDAWYAAFGVATGQRLDLEPAERMRLRE